MKQLTIDFNKPGRTIIHIPDADPNSVGAFVWWALNGPLDLNKLADSWSPEIADYPLPTLPSEATALRRAVHEQQNRRRLARPLAGDRAGYALVTETKSEDISKGLEYTTNIQVWLDNDKIKFSPENHDLHDVIKAAYEKHLMTVSADDVRHWLSQTVLPKVLSVKLRSSGGVYFIPQTLIRQFRLLVGSVRHSSAHQIFAVAAQHSEDAVEGILESIRAETAAEVELMNEDLKKGDLGVRAIKSRIEKLEEQVKKVARYEDLLNKKQPALHVSLSDLKAHLCEAQMKAEQSKAA